MIRPVRESDRAIWLSFCKAFYDSDAVLEKVPEKNFVKTFNLLMQGTPFADGFILEDETGIVGYALLARTWSQEAGGEVIWIEEIYLTPEGRGKGLGSAFFRFLETEYAPEAKRFRLEVEKENEGAVSLYKRLGFSFFSYDPMKKDF